MVPVRVFRKMSKYLKVSSSDKDKKASLSSVFLFFSKSKENYLKKKKCKSLCHTCAFTDGALFFAVINMCGGAGAAPFTHGRDVLPSFNLTYRHQNAHLFRALVCVIPYELPESAPMPAEYLCFKLLPQKNVKLHRAVISTVPQ